MFRALTTIAAIAALAVSAAPASAGLLSSPLGVSGAMVTPSGGEILGSDWLKAPPSFTVDPQDGATRQRRQRDGEGKRARQDEGSASGRELRGHTGPRRRRHERLVMIRVPVILAAAAALVLPAAHYIDDALGTGARTLGASVALAAPGVATDKPRPTPPLHRLLHRDRVTSRRTETACRRPASRPPLLGTNVRYALLIENGCASSEPARPCPPPVTGLTVTVNDDVVFQNDDAFTKARSEITLNPAGTQLNSLVLAARGAPGTAARVRIIAIRVATRSGLSGAAR